MIGNKIRTIAGRQSLLSRKNERNENSAVDSSIWTEQKTEKWNQHISMIYENNIVIVGR